MKRFLNEIKKASNSNPVSKGILEVSEIAIQNKSETVTKLVSPLSSTSTLNYEQNNEKLLIYSTKKKEKSDYDTDEKKSF